MNLALGAAAGRMRATPEDVVAILNPDLHFLPGTVEALLDYVRASIASAARRPARLHRSRSWDVFNLPRNPLPTWPSTVGRDPRAQLHPALCRSLQQAVA